MRKRVKLVFYWENVKELQKSMVTRGIDMHVGLDNGVGDLQKREMLKTV